MKYSIEEAKEIIESKMKVYNISQLGEGNHCQAFIVNDAYVIKLPKHKRANDCLIKEIKILDLLKDKIDLNIPTVEFVGHFKNRNIEFVFYASNKVNGHKLSKREFQHLDNNTLNKNAELMAKFLLQLHSFKDIFGSMRKDYCLLHGDFSLNHCLFDENNIVSGILDFADARKGKFMSDFVYLLDDKDDEEFGSYFGNLVLNKYREFQTY